MTTSLPNIGLGKIAADIAQRRPKYWEYLLFAQLLDDEISYAKAMLIDDSLTKLRVRSTFRAFRTIEDLSSYLNSNIASLDYLGSYPLQLQACLPEKNIEAFGPPGIDGNIAAIKMLARKVSCIYFEIGLIHKEKQVETEIFDIFLLQNIDQSIEQTKIIWEGIRKITNYLSALTSSLIIFIQQYSHHIRETVHAAVEGKSYSKKWRLETPSYDEFEIAHPTNEISSQPITALKPCELFIDGVPQEIKSVREVVIWLASQSIVDFAQMRKILLPLNLLPSAFINDVNEIALEKYEEIALGESANEVFVNQAVMTKIKHHWE